MLGKGGKSKSSARTSVKKASSKKPTAKRKLTPGDVEKATKGVRKTRIEAIGKGLVNTKKPSIKKETER